MQTRLKTDTKRPRPNTKSFKKIQNYQKQTVNNLKETKKKHKNTTHRLKMIKKTLKISLEGPYTEEWGGARPLSVPGGLFSDNE